MVKQPRIAIAFYTPAKERQVVIVNSVSRFFVQAEQLAKELPCWAMRDTDRAWEQVYAKYPEVQALWRALAGAAMGFAR